MGRQPAQQRARETLLPRFGIPFAPRDINFETFAALRLEIDNWRWAGVPFYLGGTSLLIVVNVTMDTVSQIQSHLIAHQYGDLIKKAKLKGGKRR